MNNKRRRTNAGRGKEDIIPSLDYISNLPDVILENILQRLSIRDAVRTTVLSSKWKDKWMTVQQLVFDKNYRKPSDRKVVQTDKFAGIINNVLSQHRGDISKFELSVFNLTAQNSPNYIRRWIDLLATKNIQDLTIEVETWCYSAGCDSLYACENLRVLKLKLGVLVVPDSNNEFKNLKDLWLEGIFIYKDLNKLLSKCPVLEKLTLLNIPMYPLEIDVKTVKFLHIRLFGDVRIINAKAVTNFIIHVSKPSPRIDQNRIDSSKLSAVLSCIPEIERLEVSSYSMKFLALGGAPRKLPITLNKLKHTTLVINFGDMGEISTALSLLRGSPNLKWLKISAWFQETTLTTVGDLWKKEQEYFCHLKHLKSLILEKACCAKYEVEFIHYLLENSPELEKLTIDVGENGYNGEYQWLQGLAPHKRFMLELLKVVNK